MYLHELLRKAAEAARSGDLREIDDLIARLEGLLIPENEREAFMTALEVMYDFALQEFVSKNVRGDEL